jgi:hypothetical protein
MTKKMDAEALAEQFYNIWASLADVHGLPGYRSENAWQEILKDRQRAHEAAAWRIMLCDLEDAMRATHEPEASDAHIQSLALDRTIWQRRLGVLLTLVEEFCRQRLRSATPEQCVVFNTLLRDAYRLSNANPMTGNVMEPHADLAERATRATLELAFAGGIIQAGPNAPAWMRDAERELYPVEAEIPSAPAVDPDAAPAEAE